MPTPGPLLQRFGEEMGFGVTIAPLLAQSDDVVSSTAIRIALSGARPRDAAAMLGHWHRIEGQVIGGEQRGQGVVEGVGGVALGADADQGQVEIAGAKEAVAVAFDAEGYLFLCDRKSDMIISGGVNVFPRDIEEVVVRHPDILEAAVFGVADSKWGESPVAAVRLTAGATAQADEIRAWINERVAARYQKVRDVVIRETFPLSVAGKTLRRELRDDYLERKK